MRLQVYRVHYKYQHTDTSDPYCWNKAYDKEDALEVFEALYSNEKCVRVVTKLEEN